MVLVPTMPTCPSRSPLPANLAKPVTSRSDQVVGHAGPLVIARNRHDDASGSGVHRRRGRRRCGVSRLRSDDAAVDLVREDVDVLDRVAIGG